MGLAAIVAAREVRRAIRSEGGTRSSCLDAILPSLLTGARGARWQAELRRR